VSFNVDPGSGRIGLRLSHDAGELVPAQVSAMAESYLRALSAMALAPHAEHRSTALLSEGERQQLTLEWAGGWERLEGEASLPVVRAGCGAVERVDGGDRRGGVD